VLGVFIVAPVSQIKEPPQNPGRFSAVKTNPVLQRTPQTIEGNNTPAQSGRGSSIQHRKNQLNSFSESALSGLKSKSQEGAIKLKAGTSESSELLGQKIKEKVSEHFTPEKIVAATMIVGKIAVKSAPALAAGPAGLAAFGTAVMENGGTELAKDIAHKAHNKMVDPEFQKRVLTEGVAMTAQAFSSPPPTAKSE
jgi:hypothetical protein